MFNRKRGKNPVNKAQVTIFIIVSIILLGVIGLLFYINKPRPIEESSNPEFRLIQDSLLKCFEGISKESLDNVGYQGGYFQEPLTEYVDTGFYMIPFYYYGQLIFVPDKGFVQEELSYAFETKKDRCLNLMSDYGMYYQLKYKKANVTITKDKVRFLNNINLVLIKGNEKASIDFTKYPVNIKSGLSDMIDSSNYIAFAYQINEGKICMSCFIDVVNANKQRLDIYDDYKGVLVFDIRDNRTGYTPRVYTFLTTDKKVETVNPIIGNKSVSIPIPELNLTAPKVENENA